VFFVPRAGAIERALERAGGVEGLAPNRFPPDVQQALWELELAMSAYRAAATLYELFSSERAFHEWPVGTLPVPISSANPLLPRGLDAVFEKGFAYEKVDRFDTAFGFWQAIEAATRGTTIASGHEVTQWVQRYRAEPTEVPSGVADSTQSISIATPSKP